MGRKQHHRVEVVLEEDTKALLVELAFARRELEIARLELSDAHDDVKTGFRFPWVPRQRVGETPRHDRS